ncbi:MAG: homocysteine S-methyltransferase family protein [Clostridia bacterium]|nr:homocysteine S-methyltransferase family protein [Clostridia bacterium]
MNFIDFLKENIVFLDGGMGTILQSKGLGAGEHPELWNITHPDIIKDIHKAYFDAGSNVVNTNTFGANLLNFSLSELDDIIRNAIKNADDARRESNSEKEKFIALDIGPSGKLLKPYGDFDFEVAVELFAQTVRLGVKYGADLITIETMNDSYETKAALLAAKENSDLPVIVTNAYGEDGKLMTGASPEAMVAMLEGMGADAIGANCSLGPKQLISVVERLLDCASVPVILKPNAGLPKTVNGETVFDVTADEFSDDVKALVLKGVRVVGGCCGTTPEYIKALTEKIKDIQPKAIEQKNDTVVSSYTHAVKFGASPLLIGERINPTGKKRFKQALIENDIPYILNEGLSQQEKGVHILDVNVGLPDIDEKKMLVDCVCELQAIINLPLQIDTSDCEAMEAALRRYNGKAMINSVNGKEESMKAVFPLVKKYGGVVVALTLDENGIPSTADERVEIAKKILITAEEYGINKKDIIFDTLAMTISADNNAANVTLEALNSIKNELGCHTSLGVSNISFGLPNRDAVNGTFFALALENGLSAAIMNPHSAEMMKTYFTYRALRGLDANCADYINAADSFTTSSPVAKATTAVADTDMKSALQNAVVKGLKEQAGEITKELLKENEPLDIVQNEIIPALDTVGKGFENKTVYLPQLLMSAEAAKSAFEIIKSQLSIKGGKGADKGRFVIATVHGDIHDIGKNIVKLLLENYGFAVTDLGKDVPPEVIVEEVIKQHAPLVGLSALMTTTVPAMEETIKLIKEKAPWCKTVVGGAVLNKEYAEKIGADKYCKDAMETVRYAEEIIKA